jgi:GSCFA family
MKNIKLNTPVKVPQGKDRLGPQAVIAGIGSCFAQNVLERLHESGFVGQRNPCGIVYNSASIAESLLRISREKYFEKEDFFEYDGLWRNWSMHGQFAERTMSKSLSKANYSLRRFRETLREANLLILTPSSSVIYVLRENGKIVANCHKIPNHRFEQRLMSYEQNLQMLQTAVDDVQKINPECRILFTLSPVRHYPGDPMLNSRSKANLLSAIRQCVDTNADVCSYFPAYEILNDELRDYRFYKADMCHPSEQGVEIIFQRFAETWFTPDAIQKIEAGKKTAKAAAHRPRKK